MSDRHTVAAFDVDGTLSTHDCVVPFLRRVAGTARLTRRLAGRAHRLLPALVRRDRDTIKALATHAALAGLDERHLREEGERFGAAVAAGGLRDDVVARLRWHRSQGHSIVLVSASYEVYLGALAKGIGGAGVVGTRLVAAGGRLTGELDGRNCRGPEKVRRLHAWLDANHGGRDAVELWAYGDSAGDRELLADADHPVWVRAPLSSVVPS